MAPSLVSLATRILTLTPNFQYQGCYTDLIPQRVLPALRTVSDGMTLEMCAQTCAEYPWFGTEWHTECYCGLALDPNSVLADDDSQCSYACAGDETEMCGGSALISVYTNSAASGPSDPEAIGNYEFQGCWTDLTPGRVLPVAMGADSQMTPELCATKCAGYPWFGVEWSTECYCGLELDQSSVNVELANCQMACAGSASEICGGSALLSLYHDTTASTPGGQTGGQTGDSGLVAPPMVGDYSYQGCFSDLTPGVGRVLSAAHMMDDAEMSIENCATFCAAFPWFGVEYSRECYCGVALDGSSEQQADDTVCNMPCAGDATEPCGGPSLLTAYYNPWVAQPSDPAQVGDYEFMGCWQDDTTSRSLQDAVYKEAGMTLEVCAERCAGFLWFGTEYADECYCGNTLLSEDAPMEECNMVCDGDDMEPCGGPNRLSLYSYNPSPLRSCGPNVPVRLCGER